MSLPRLSAVALLAALSSCSDTTTCDGSLVPAIQVTVRDQQTGALIGAQTTIIAKLNGGSPDSTTSGAGSDANPVWVGRLPGTYDLVVRKAGYSDLSINNIVVGSDGACHPSTKLLEAHLTKTS